MPWPGESPPTRVAPTGTWWDHVIRLDWSELFLRLKCPRRRAMVTLLPGALVTEQAASGLSLRLSSMGLTQATSLSAVASAAG